MIVQNLLACKVHSTGTFDGIWGIQWPDTLGMQINWNQNLSIHPKKKAFDGTILGTIQHGTLPLLVFVFPECDSCGCLVCFPSIQPLSTAEGNDIKGSLGRKIETLSSFPHVLWYHGLWIQTWCLKAARHGCFTSDCEWVTAVREDRNSFCLYRSQNPRVGTLIWYFF